MKKLLLLTLVILSMCKGAPDPKTVLSPAEFQEKIKNTPGAVILDVRTLSEVQAECIRGEMNLDYKSPDFGTLIKGLDKSKTYLVYCAGGVRSAKAADALRDLDFPNVYSLEGGIDAWKAANLPTRKSLTE